MCAAVFPANMFPCGPRLTFCVSVCTHVRAYSRADRQTDGQTDTRICVGTSTGDF